MFATKDRLPQGAAPSPHPVTLAAPNGISSNLRQEPQTRPFVFNKLRTPLWAQKLQPAHFQSPTHSFINAKNITAVFPITSPLFVRSSAQARKLSSLFSCIPARSRRKWGCGRKPAPRERKSPVRGVFAVSKYTENLVRHLDWQYSLLSRFFAISPAVLRPTSRKPSVAATPDVGRGLHLQPAGKIGSNLNNLSKMNTYAKSAANSCRMRTSKIIALKVSYNEHLQKKGAGEVLLLPSQNGKFSRVWAPLGAHVD